MLWNVHIIVKGAKVSLPQTVDLFFIRASSHIYTSNQSVKTIRWPLQSDKPSVLLCPCCWLNCRPLHKDYTKLLLIVLIDFFLLHLSPPIAAFYYRS